jgi:hypothetical protein
MVNFANSKVYSIRSYKTDDIYIGSTTQTLAQRLAKHKTSLKRWKNGSPEYMTSFEIIKHGDAYIELVEACPCSTREELHKREGQIIRSTENCVNKNIAGRTIQEWYQDHREVVKSRRVQHYVTNKERSLEVMKTYLQQNRDEILAWKRKKIMCSYCGSPFRQSGKSHHIKTQKHQANYKKAFKDCFGTEFEGSAPSHDY